MLFIFIVWRIPISLCRARLQQQLHTAVYSRLRLPLLISFLRSVNRVKCEAYHKCSPVMCSQPQQCQQIGFRGQTISWEGPAGSSQGEEEDTTSSQETGKENIPGEYMTASLNWRDCSYIRSPYVMHKSGKLEADVWDEILAGRRTKKILNVKEMFLLHSSFLSYTALWIGSSASPHLGNVHTCNVPTQLLWRWRMIVCWFPKQSKTSCSNAVLSPRLSEKALTWACLPCSAEAWHQRQVCTLQPIHRSLSPLLGRFSRFQVLGVVWGCL